MDHKDFELFKDLPEPDKEFRRLYPDAYKDLDPKQLECFGNPLFIGMFFDCDHAHNKVANWLNEYEMQIPHFSTVYSEQGDIS